MKKQEEYKSGIVALVGRPNAGKSTLLNAIIGHKVAITSPKPQTTQFLIQAVYDDARGQIVFTDTPGIFARLPEIRSGASGQTKTTSKNFQDINFMAQQALHQVDVIVYVIDRTRERGIEENRVLGMIRKIDVPKILVFNKIDKREETFIEQYKFLEEEFDAVINLSAKTHENINVLIDTIFEFLKAGEKIVSDDQKPVTALNFDSKLYVEELIREKAFLRLRREVPYVIRVSVLDITEKPQKNMSVITAKIYCPERYKKMIIGAGGAKIKEIGMMVRRELEIATNRKIYLDLTVVGE